MDWKGLILLLTTTMSLHSSALACPEECECYHGINLYTANCSSFPTSNENELAKFEVFNLSPMALVPLDLKEGQFVGFKKLKYLSLSNCSIYYVHKKAFYGLKNLIEIDLSFNDIQTLDPMVFQHNNDLTSLILRGNPIKFTANTPFLASNTIQHLDLGLCSIKVIPRGVFFGVKKIMYMSLDGNRLKTLKYNSLPRGLKYLNIANNMIINVPIELLTSMTNLHRLDLSGNPINCTCPLMDLQDWLSGRGVTFDNEVICASPPQYAGRSWNEVNENELCITESLVDNMQKRPLKKFTKKEFKNKEKYYFSSDKNEYLETSALQADEPARFVDDKMDPNAEILFQNDETKSMGEIMREKELVKTEKPDDKLENDTDGGDILENDTKVSEVTDVENEDRKTAFDYVGSDDPDLKEEENENKEDEGEQSIGVITSDNEEHSSKQHDTDNGSVLPLEDQIENESDEQNLQNDDVNNVDSTKTAEGETVKNPLTDIDKNESKETTESDDPPVDQSAEKSKKEPIPVEEHDDEYDKTASEALLTVDQIHKKEDKQNTVETNPTGNAPEDNNGKELIKNEGTSEHNLNEENISEIKSKNTDNQASEEKTQNEIRKGISGMENMKEEEHIEEHESKKEELVPENSETNNTHSPHGWTLEKDLLAQEDLIEPIDLGNNEEYISDLDSTEEPAKNVDENNIDTGVIIDASKHLEQKVGQIKAAESVDEHDKIENSDLKPETETDITQSENLSVVSETNTGAKTNGSVSFESASNGTSNTEDKIDEGLSKPESLDILTDSSKEGKSEEVVTNNTDSVNIIKNDHVAEEVNVVKHLEHGNVDSKNEAESIEINKEIEEIITAAPQAFKAEELGVLTAVKSANETSQESKTDYNSEVEINLETKTDEKFGNLMSVRGNNKSEEALNEKGTETTAEPLDNKDKLKNEMHEEMLITVGSDEILNNTDSDDYDVSTTQATDVLVSAEEPESILNETGIVIANNGTDSLEINGTYIGTPEVVPVPKEEAEIDESTELVTVAVTEHVISKQKVSDIDTEPEVTTNLPAETTGIIGATENVTPGEILSEHGTNISYVSTSNKPNADFKESVPSDEVRQTEDEGEPFEFQEAHIVLTCILILVLALVLFSVYKCTTNKNKSTKRITKDIESNHGTEMQDMASLLPKPSEDDNKSTKKYPEDASSNEKVKLITEDKEEDDNQFQRGNETQAVVEKENTLNNNAPNLPNKPTSVNRTATPTTINPMAPIQRTKVKVAIIPESIPRTPIFVQKTYNNGVPTNG